MLGSWTPGPSVPQVSLGELTVSFSSCSSSHETLEKKEEEVTSEEDEEKEEEEKEEGEEEEYDEEEHEEVRDFCSSLSPHTPSSPLPNSGLSTLSLSLLKDLFCCSFVCFLWSRKLGNTI